MLGKEVEDCSEVELIGPQGPYSRFFETAPLETAGFGYGDPLRLIFSRRVEPGRITLILEVTRGVSTDTPESLRAEVAETTRSVDFDLIGRAFGRGPTG